MIFTILLPNYTHFSAGVRVLWYLGNLLGQLGHKVFYINYQNASAPKPAWSTMEMAPDNTTQGTIISPEVFPELECPHIRWALNKPGLLGGPTTYPTGTQVYHFTPELEESAAAASPDGQSKLFMLGSLDKPTLPPTDRKLITWYRGKYQGPVDLNNHVNQIEMTRNWPVTKQQYWELLNQTDVFYSYDNFSGTPAEAYLCNCKVLVWNGTAFEGYIPQPHLSNLIIDEKRDLESVQAFVDSLQL